MPLFLPHELFSCLSLNFQLFVCGLFKNSTSITGTLWLSARYLASNKRVTCIAVRAFHTALWQQRRTRRITIEKFIVVSMGYHIQGVTAQRWLKAEAARISLSFLFKHRPLVLFCFFLVCVCLKGGRATFLPSSSLSFLCS